MKILIIITLFLIYLNPEVFGKFVNNKGDTIYNQTDEEGLKQGYWKKQYSNGSLKYKGGFINDKPVGEFRRYFENGQLKALMIFDKKSELVNTIIYYEDGRLAAEGQYIKNKKDSTWNYYSYYSQTLVCKESYINGLKHGISIKYYNNGNFSEELEWKDDAKDGKWNQYFESREIKMKSFYKSGLRDGYFKLFYKSGQIEIEGQYINNRKHDYWTYYDENGNTILKVDYEYGNPVNKEVLHQKEKEFFQQMEENLGKIQEPNEADFVPYLNSN